jgi:valyl-tRNA synthetase
VDAAVNVLLSPPADMVAPMKTYALYAPFVPFVTEGVYQRIYRPFENAVSIHVGPWPQFVEDRPSEVPEMNVVTAILRSVRRLRSEQQIPQARTIAALTIDLEDALPEFADLVRRMELSLRAATPTGAGHRRTRQSLR